MNYELMKQANIFKPENRAEWQKYKIAKRTLDVLIEHCDEDGDTFVGIKTIAQRLLVSNQTVMNHFEILKNLNILQIQNVCGRSIKNIKVGSNMGSKNEKIVSSSEGSSEGSKVGSKVSSSDGSSEGSSLLEANKEREYKEGIRGSAKASDNFSEEVRLAIRDSVMEVFNHIRKIKKIAVPIALNKINHQHYKTLFIRFKDAKQFMEIEEDEFPALIKDMMFMKFKQQNFLNNDSITFNTFLYKSNFEKYLEELLGSM